MAGTLKQTFMLRRTSPEACHCMHMCVHILSHTHINKAQETPHVNVRDAMVEKGGMRNISRLIQPGIRSGQISRIINKWLTFPVCVVTSPRGPARAQQGLDPILAVYQCKQKLSLVKPPWQTLGGQTQNGEQSSWAKSLLPLWFTAQTSQLNILTKMAILFPLHHSLLHCLFVGHFCEMIIWFPTHITAYN